MAIYFVWTVQGFTAIGLWLHVYQPNNLFSMACLLLMVFVGNIYYGFA